jgi:hypothetical protein
MQVHGAQIYLSFNGRPALRTSFNSIEKPDSNNNGYQTFTKKYATLSNQRNWIRHSREL